MPDLLIKLILIRHGRTPGNLERRYVGRTDESLDAEAAHSLEASRGAMPAGVSFVYTSPMRRCRETARILFPDNEAAVADGFRECDFGDFEYKNFEELSADSDYQAWIDSGGKLSFPGGEDPQRFRERTVRAFDGMIGDIIRAETAGTAADTVTAALICHGGTVMSVLGRYSRPHRDYFDWMLPNGGWYQAQIDAGRWAAGERYISAVQAGFTGEMIW